MLILKNQLENFLRLPMCQSYPRPIKIDALEVRARFQDFSVHPKWCAGATEAEAQGLMQGQSQMLNIKYVYDIFLKALIIFYFFLLWSL